jgi:hypothetical protein
LRHLWSAKWPLPGILDEDAKLGRALFDQAAARQRDDPARQGPGVRR